MKTIVDFSRAKREQHPIVLIAAYDALMARLVAESEADAILVGDSLAVVGCSFRSQDRPAPARFAVNPDATRPQADLP